MTSHETEIYANAVDSLQHSIAHYLVRRENPTAIKHAILTLYHSIELFLKERLARVHPILIYRNIDKPISDDAPTVGLDHILARLSNLKIGLSVPHKDTIQELQRRRNRIEHHRFDPERDHEFVVGHAIKFLLEFLPDHLGVRLSDLVEEEETFQELLDAALTYKDRLEHAHKEVRATGQPATTCPRCGEDTLSVDDHYCYYCHTSVRVEECENCGRLVAPDEISLQGTCNVCTEELFSRF